MLKELATKYFNASTQQVIQFEHLAQAFVLPSTQGMLGKYEEAIDVISSVNPLLGFRLAQKTQIAPALMVSTQAAMQHEQISTIWLLLEEEIRDLPAINELILELAELHSIDLRHEVRYHLDDPLSLPSNIEDALKETAKTTKPDLSQEQVG